MNNVQFITFENWFIMWLKMYFITKSLRLSLKAHSLCNINITISVALYDSLYSFSHIKNHHCWNCSFHMLNLNRFIWWVCVYVCAFVYYFMTTNSFSLWLYIILLAYNFSLYYTWFCRQTKTQIVLCCCCSHIFLVSKKRRRRWKNFHFEALRQINPLFNIHYSLSLLFILVLTLIPSEKEKELFKKLFRIIKALGLCNRSLSLTRLFIVCLFLIQLCELLWWC